MKLIVDRAKHIFTFGAMIKNPFLAETAPTQIRT